MACTRRGATLQETGGRRMNDSNTPLHVAIAGAGVAALETALALQALGADWVRVERMEPEQECTCRPLAVAEAVRADQVRRFPLGALVKAAGAALRGGAVAGVAADEKQIRLDDCGTLDYAAFVLA